MLVFRNDGYSTSFKGVLLSEIFSKTEGNMEGEWIKTLAAFFFKKLLTN
jgi:hypothetical protein